MASPTHRLSNARRTSVKQRKGQHILDVNVRAHQASRQRKQRMSGLLCLGLIFICLGAGLFFGGRKLAMRLFLKNPDYNLVAIDVQTDGVLPPEYIAATAELEKGTNIFTIDLDGARARLSVIPEVEKVSVSRQVPNRVAIEVIERKPIAWIAPVHANDAPRDEVVNSGKSFLIDSNGFLLPPRKPLPQNAHLPIIRGYAGPTTLGQKADGEEIWSTLDLLHAHQDTLVAARYQIEEVDLSKHFGLVVTDQNGTHTLFGLEDMSKQLKKMETILENAERHGQQVDTMNLLVENNIPVTFRLPPAPDPAAVVPSGLNPRAGAAKPAPPVKAASAKKEAPAAKREKKPKGPETRRVQALQPFGGAEPAAR